MLMGKVQFAASHNAPVVQTHVHESGNIFNVYAQGAQPNSGFRSFSIAHYYINVQWVEQPPVLAAYGRDYATQY
jgi:hypothetical protein